MSRRLKRSLLKNELLSGRLEFKRFSGNKKEVERIKNLLIFYQKIILKLRIIRKFY